MRKSLKVLVLVGVLSIASTFTSLASWEQIGTQWKYSENNGYLSNGWYWIDGNGDSVAECYYLDVNGVMAVNTVVDNYTVNENGAWTIDGVIQTKVVNASSDKGGSESSQNQSNSGMPSLSDITGTVGSTEWGDTQCGDSTGLPPMQSGASGGSSESQSPSSSQESGGFNWDDYFDEGGVGSGGPPVSQNFGQIHGAQ